MRAIEVATGKLDREFDRFAVAAWADILCLLLGAEKLLKDGR